MTRKQIYLLAAEKVFFRPGLYGCPALLLVQMEGIGRILTDHYPELELMESEDIFHEDIYEYGHLHSDSGIFGNPYANKEHIDHRIFGLLFCWVMCDER